MATTEKRQQIIQGLLRDFPDGEASRRELMDWAIKNGLNHLAEQMAIVVHLFDKPQMVGILSLVIQLLLEMEMSFI